MIQCKTNFARSVFTAALVVTLILVPTASGQETRGTIQGRALDRSQAALPNASVSVTNVDTNVTSKTTSNNEGAYVLPYLNPGIYKLVATAKGFKSIYRNGIELRVHDRLQIDLVFEVGDVSEQITVTGETPLLETASANTGQIIDSRRAAELPTFDGSPLSLVFLSSDIIYAYPNAATATQQPQLQQNSITQSNFAGSPRGTTEFTMDGVPNMQNSIADYGSGVVNSPPADIVQEFKVEQAYDASVGHTSGMVVNFSLKSGTNQLHGAAYYADREPELNANNWFANRSGQSRGDFSYRRSSASLTGPGYFPKLYNGKDRTFFTYGYETLHLTETSQAYTTTVPTSAQLKGDFSSLLAISSQYQIYDPATWRPTGTGRYQADPIPGNIIPTSRLSPIALAIAKHWPASNTTGQTGGVNNYTNNNNGTIRSYYNHVGRVDHVISDKQRMYVRVAANQRTDGPYRKYWDDVVSGQNWNGPARQIAIDDIYVLNPSTILNIRYGANRYAGQHSPDREGYDVTALGFPDATARQLRAIRQMFPTISVSGLVTLANESPDVLNSTNHSILGNISKTYRNHSFKFGGEFRVYQNNVFYPGAAAGTFSFSTNYTKGPYDNSTSSPSSLGQGLASFLLGIPTSGGIATIDNQASTSNYIGIFFHDNWRVSRKLTLDVGLRWERESAVTERYNRSVGGFDPNAVLSITSAAESAYAAKPDASMPASQFLARGGLLYAGVSGVPQSFWNAPKGIFAPRVGFSYQAAKRIVIRSGLGVFPIEVGVPAKNLANQIGYSQTTSLVSSLDYGQTYIGTLATPFPAGVTPAVGNSLGVNTYLGQSVSFYDRNASTPYSMRWSFGVQTELPRKLLWEVSYNGSKTIHLTTARSLSSLPFRYLSTSPVRDQTTIDYLSNPVANPFYNLIPGTSRNGSTVTRSVLLSPYPQFTGVTVTNFQGYSWYNSLNTRLERRFANGFTVQSTYGFAKQIDCTSYQNGADPRPTRSISGLDRTHNLAFSGIFELPFGRGKALFGQAGNVANSIVGGWQIGAIYHFTSGAPLSFGNVIYYSGDFSRIPLSTDERTVNRWFNIDAGFERNSAKQLGANVRTFPLYLSNVRSDYVNNWDMDVIKNFKFRERYSVQFRAEFLNAINHPNAFAPPNTTVTSSAFGTITSQYGSARIVQMQLKFVF